MVFTLGSNRSSASCSLLKFPTNMPLYAELAPVLHPLAVLRQHLASQSVGHCEKSPILGLEFFLSYCQPREEAGTVCGQHNAHKHSDVVRPQKDPPEKGESETEMFPSGSIPESCKQGLPQVTPTTVRPTPNTMPSLP